MSINAYVGLPGSGKSYSVVENVIIPALKENKRVWTNIPLELDLLESEGYPRPVIFETSEIVENPDFFQDTFEAGATIIIDECWRFWASGLKASNMNEGHKSFFAEHRHMVGTDGNSTEIALVTQDLSQIAATVRNLVEFTNRTVKLNAIGQANKFRVDIYQGAVTGPKPPESQRLRQLFSSYKPEIYRFYQSQTMNNSSDHGSEGSTDDRMNILNSKFLKIGAPIFLVTMLTFIYYGFNEFTKSYTGEKEETEIVFDDVKDEVITPQITKQEPEELQPDPRLLAITKNADITITYNNGTFPWIEYIFTVERKSHKSTLTLQQLRQVGFMVQPISPCLAIISNKTNHITAMCQENQLIEPNTDEFSSSVAEFNPLD